MLLVGIEPGTYRSRIRRFTTAPQRSTGNFSSPFRLECGCKQGDPISTYIFILCAEILAIKIRNNEKIKGIKINNIDFKLVQFADDTTIILDGSENLLTETLNELGNFAKIPGLKVNFQKTQLIWLGKKSIAQKQ